MSTEFGQGILGLTPDWLKYGVLGLLGISIIVVAVVVFSGQRNKASFRLALLFMGFTLIVAGLAIASDIYKDTAGLKQIVAERDAAVAENKELKAERDNTVEVAGTVTIDQASLQGVDAVLIGVTSSQLSETFTPNGGHLDFKMPVPKAWNYGYTAYAFAYGRSGLRPVTAGFRLDNPKFALELKP